MEHNVCAYTTVTYIFSIPVYCIRSFQLRGSACNSHTLIIPESALNLYHVPVNEWRNSVLIHDHDFSQKQPPLIDGDQFKKSNK